MNTVSSVDALDQAIRSALAPITWISSAEPLFDVQAAALVRRRARELGFTERSVIDVGAGFDASMIAGEVQSLSLFGERRLLDLRLGARAQKSFGESLAAATASVAEDVRLLVTGGALDKVQQNTKWFKEVAPRLLLVDIPAMQPQNFEPWLRARLKAAGLRMSPEAFGLLLERSEGNVLAAHQTLERLQLSGADASAEIPVDDVDEAIQDSAHFEVYSLVDAALAADLPRALRILRGLAQEQAPLPRIVWVLADCLRKLIAIQGARAEGAPVQQAMRAARVFGRQEALYRGALSRLSGRMAWALLRETAWLDKLSKGVASGIGISVAVAPGGQPDPGEAGASFGPTDEWAAVERIVVALAGGRRLAA